jgi:hypothetical protein
MEAAVAGRTRWRVAKMQRLLLRLLTALYCQVNLIAAQVAPAPAGPPSFSKINYGKCGADSERQDFSMETPSGTGRIIMADGRCLAVKDCAVAGGFGAVGVEACGPGSCEGKHQHWSTAAVPRKEDTFFVKSALTAPPGDWCLNIPPSKEQGDQQWPLTVWAPGCKGSAWRTPATVSEPNQQKSISRFCFRNSPDRARASEKDAKLAQKLAQLQPFIAVFPQECMG